MLEYRFGEAVIHSHARLTYTEVAELFQAPEEQSPENKTRKPSRLSASLTRALADLHDLHQVLHRRRAESGSIEFETVETRIVLDDAGAVREIVPVARNDAHRLIEECMLCANVAAARLLRESALPTLYRVHPGPEAEKLADLREYFRGLGLVLKGGDQPRPADYRRLLEKLKGRPDRTLLQTLLIRSLSQAVYQPENIGHFGLNFPHYTHFTSPIRRYPDLLVHRAIRYLVRRRRNPGGRFEKLYPYNPAHMEELGETCSAAERRADAAGYLSVNWLKCEYLREHLGDEFDGIISAVTGFGLFVQLTGLYVDGLVHISMLGDDYYHHDPVQHFLEGESRGVIFRLGDPVRVQVISVMPKEQKIELRLAGVGEQEGGSGPGPTRKRSGGGRQRRGRSAGRGGNRGRYSARGRGRK